MEDIMIEKKFRAYDTVRNEYLSAGKVLISIEAGNYPKNIIYLDILKHPDNYKNRFIIEQYSGFKDKDQKEGYENNLYSFTDNDLKNKGPYLLLMDEKNGCYALQSITKNGFELSIHFLHKMTCIGNIHKYEVKNAD